MSSPETIPNLRTLPQGVFLEILESFGVRLNWSFRFEVLFLCTSHQVSTHLLKGRYLGAG